LGYIDGLKLIGSKYHYRFRFNGQAQRMVGHKHIVTTMRYIEVAKERREAFDALERLQGLSHKTGDGTLKTEKGNRNGLLTADGHDPNRTHTLEPSEPR